MTDKKSSRRVQFTRDSLRSALVDLTAEKPLADITVTDICARADINRSTFYLHYQGVHELIREMEEQLIAHMRESLAPSQLTQDNFAAFLNAVRASPRLRALMTSLLGEQGDPQFVRQVQQLTFDIFQQAWKDHPPVIPNLNEGHKSLIYSYLISSTVFTLSAWVRGEIPELDACETVELLGRLICHGVNSILPRPPSAAKGDFWFQAPTQ